MPEPRLRFRILPVLASMARKSPWKIAGKHQISASGEGAAIERQVFLDGPDLLVLHRIPRHEFTEEATRALLGREFGAKIEHAALVGDVANRPVHANSW